MAQRILTLALLGAFGVFGCSHTAATRPLHPKAKLEICHVADSPLPGSTRATDPSDGSELFLISPPLIDSADIAGVTWSETGDGHGALTINTTPAGAAKLSAATSKLIDERVALVVNGRVIAAPSIHAPVGESFQVQSGVIDQEGERLVKVLTIDP